MTFDVAEFRSQILNPYFHFCSVHHIQATLFCRSCCSPVCATCFESSLHLHHAIMSFTNARNVFLRLKNELENQCKGEITTNKEQIQKQKANQSQKDSQLALQI